MRIAIIGQGYVGLALAKATSIAGHKVVGFDTNLTVIEDINNQITKGEFLNNSNYLPTNKEEDIKDQEIYIIAVPTPLDKNNLPDISYLNTASKLIAESAPNGALVINESTSYPGTLREIVITQISKSNKANFLYAAAPERIDPANTKWNIKNTPRVIAGVDEASTKAAFKFYQSICDQVEVVSAALRAVGVAGDDLCTDDTAKYIEAEKLLAGYKPAVIESDGGIERVVAGTSNVRHAWNGSTHRMTVENPDVQYIYPSDGLNLWADNLAVPVGAPNLDNAKIFINWMMSPESAGAQSNFSGYDNGIKGSDAFMDDALKTDPAVVVPADKQALISPLPNCGEEARELYTQVFTTWTTGQ